MGQELLSTFAEELGEVAYKRRGRGRVSDSRE